MADLDEVIRKIRETADQLDKEIPEILLRQEITAKSLVQVRIQETGKDSKGGQLGNYSNTKIPPFFFMGKGTKSSDAKLRVLAKEGKKISYAQFRAMDGKQSGYVDLTFTGKMFRETGLIKKQASKNEAVIVIGQTSQRSEKVAGFLEKRYGNFLALTDEELEEITQDMLEEVQEIINQNLNGI